MKKFLKYLLILLVICAAAIFLAYLYFFSPKSKYQSVYLVPPNASLIIESDQPFTAWETFVTCNAWEKLKTNPSLAELDDDIRYLDSLFHENKLFFRLMGERNVLISLHEYEPGKNDYLYIINLGRITKLRSPETLLSAFLGSDYRITQTSHKGKTIYEVLDTEDGEMYFFSFVLDKGVVSTNLNLVEASIDEESRKALGRDVNFLDVREKVAGTGLLNLYINYKYFGKYLESEMGKSSDLTRDLDEDLLYSAFRFDLKSNGEISMDGYSSVNSKSTSFFTTIVEAGQGTLKSGAVIPSRFASMVQIHFDDAGDFYDRSIAILDEQERAEFLDQQSKLEKKLKLSVKKDFLSWIDDEIILLQTKPSNLGRMNEFAIIMPAVDATLPAEKLNYLAKQIHQKYFIKIKGIEYHGYAIRYISFPGLFKLLFGNLLDKIEKPYYTIIDKYVVFSNHPQTLKNIIDDYRANNTLINSSDFAVFSKQFKEKNTVYTYLDVPVLFTLLEEYVSKDKWKEFQEDKPYFLSFPRLGVQLDAVDGLLHSKFHTRFTRNPEEYKKAYYDDRYLLNTFTILPESLINSYSIWFEPEIIIDNLDASKIVKNYPNGAVRIKVDLKKGLLNGKYNEYHLNGNIRVKGKYNDGMREGEWVLYDLDKNVLDKKTFRDNIEQVE
ncbi:MAG: DUF3352 domain-containing protein [Bacteroidales bacterium]|nr:DUF3352 domain-containing protein [Bacteroidales bacterium]